MCVSLVPSGLETVRYSAVQEALHSIFFFFFFFCMELGKDTNHKKYDEVDLFCSHLELGLCR